MEPTLKTNDLNSAPNGLNDLKFGVPFSYKSGLRFGELMS